MLNELFCDEDKRRIMSILIPLIPREDHLVWHHSNDSVYSIKTGYSLATKVEEDVPSSSLNPRSKWWRKLWSLSLPRKVKSFAWRASLDALMLGS